jgi:phage gp45-like
MTLIDQLNRLLSPLYKRLASMICKAVIKSLDDTTGLQTYKLYLMKDEVIECVERLAEFGFTSIPPEESEAIVVFANGSRSKGVVIATDSARYRLKLSEKGSTAIYNKNGDYVKISKDKIEIFANEIILAGGTKKLLTEDILSLLNSHVHQCSSPGSPSGPALNGVLPNPFTDVLHTTQKIKAV